MQVARLKISRLETLFLAGVYLVGLYLRLAPRLEIDPHLLTFQGDIWYRLCMAQFVYDHHALPHPDIRYLAYGYVPMWYPPLSPILFALASYVSGLDIPTVSSRMVPFVEALSPLSLYFLARYLYNERVAFFATSALALTPSFLFWSGISDPQSFTLFIIPLIMMLWIDFSRSKSNLKLLAIGLLLAINFLMHLSYFITVLVLFTTTAALVLNRETGKGLFKDLAKVVIFSQVITLPWWGLMDPKTLYWWWIFALVTSSGLYHITQQLAEFGTIAALLGIFSYLYIIHQRFFRHRLRHLIIILWAVPLIIETQNEVIISALARVDPSLYSSLEWSTLGKPLEGFRFYTFLAQPFSVAAGVLAVDLAERANMHIKGSGHLLLASMILALGWGLYDYHLDVRFQTSGLIVEEYEAAEWFRDNSMPADRIIADYYRSQMFAGVCGGKALLGGMFPLRNLDYPYIKAPGVVQNHLFILYKTSNPEEAWTIAKRYGATHIFYSENMIRYGNLLSYYKPASEYGVDTDKKKFSDERYFEVVYRRPSAYGEVVIVRVKENMPFASD
jgi:hypothetical protein